ncbi:MAG: dTDP-4-dehydrorhamnose reductase family protein [Methanosarcina sp.]
MGVDNIRKNILVLGGTGMLGSMLVDYLSKKPDLEITATVRSEEVARNLEIQLPNVKWKVFDANSSDPDKALEVISGNQWVINAIGIIKPLIHDDNSHDVERAIRINSLLPHLLAKKAQEKGSRVIQIATDCVYSGDKGHYIETDAHDALDVYGKTKSLGEMYSPNVFHLRCSIIGPEPKEFKSLLEWFLGQSTNAHVNGFTNHLWNGLTTLHFAKICYGIISNDIQLLHLQHVVPGGEITKFDLLKVFSKYFNRRDISITPFEVEVPIDRTISTINDGLNMHLWKSAGYGYPPSVPEMVEELANYDYSFHIPELIIKNERQTKIGPSPKW